MCKSSTEIFFKHQEMYLKYQEFGPCGCQRITNLILHLYVNIYVYYEQKIDTHNYYSNYFDNTGVNNNNFEMWVGEANA